jgi:hypothetical protein
MPLLEVVRLTAKILLMMVVLLVIHQTVGAVFLLTPGTLVAPVVEIPMVPTVTTTKMTMTSNPQI